MNKKVLMLTLLIYISFYGNTQVMTSDNYCKKKHINRYESEMATSITFNSDSSFAIISHNYQSITTCDKDSNFVQAVIFRGYILPHDSVYILKSGDIIQTWINDQQFLAFPDSIFEFEFTRLASNMYYREILIHQEKYR